MKIRLSTHQARRNKLSQLLGNRVALIPAASVKTKNSNTEYRFRQESNFFYLTGFNEPDALLVLAPGHEKIKSAIFVRPRDPKMEVWTGRRVGPERIQEIVAVDAAYSIDDFSKQIGSLLANAEEILIDSHLFPEIFKTVHQLLPSLWASKRGPKYPQKFTSPKSLLGSMRLLKDPEELDMMKKAQEIANHAHRLAMAYANPGKNEGQIQAMLEMVFKNEGAFGEAYGSIVAGGDNANILHYIENNQVLKAGELLLIDAGPEYQYYAADITRTFPISGQFSSEQKVIYEIVLKAQENSIKHIKAGAKLSELHEISCRHLIEGLKDLKILNGSLEENLLSPFFKELYPHSTSHWLGLDVHDLGPYREETSGNELLLQENMILTVEPGLYFSQNNTQVPEKFRGIGIRIEDDIRVLQSGFENLSAAIPKKITDIEEACAQNSMDYLKKI